MRIVLNKFIYNINLVHCKTITPLLCYKAYGDMVSTEKYTNKNKIWWNLYSNYKFPNLYTFFSFIWSSYKRSFCNIFWCKPPFEWRLRNHIFDALREGPSHHLFQTTGPQSGNDQRSSAVWSFSASVTEWIKPFAINQSLSLSIRCSTLKQLVAESGRY